MSLSGRKLAKRACDGCKIRKIKCTEVAPCDGCVAAGIACTFVKQPSTRGPRRLRKSTLREITQSQQQWEDLGFGSATPDQPVVHTKLDAESVFAPTKVAALVLQLCVYRLRMYPVWPIIKVERLVASLQNPEPDIEVFGLAYAVAAATIAQLRTKPSTQPGAVTAEMMEAQCQYAKARRNRDQPPDLTTVRIPFFLHIYYETQNPGGLQSITYLREAIAIAHLVGLHRETYYSDVQPEEREIRRRTLWLLFVAERNIAIAHKLPVTIRTKIAFPGTIDSDSEHVLAAYQKLVTIFWDFDRSGVFDLLDRCDFDFAVAAEQMLSPSLFATLTTMRKMLDGNLINVESMEETQAFDLIITRHWMRIILWLLTQPRSRNSQTSEMAQDAIRQPLKIAKELLTEIAYTPGNAIEAHSSTFEIKIFEITVSILDAVRAASDVLNWNDDLADLLKEVMTQLYSFLSRNDNWAMRLRNHMSQIQEESQLHPSISFALSAAMESCVKLTNVPSIDSSISPIASGSPATSTGFRSGSLASISPQSHQLTQQEHQGSLFGAPGTLSPDFSHITGPEALEQSSLDMSWSHFGQSTEIGFSESSSGATWHNVDYLFNGT